MKRGRKVWRSCCIRGAGGTWGHGKAAGTGKEGLCSRCPEEKQRRLREASPGRGGTSPWPRSPRHSQRGRLPAHPGRNEKSEEGRMLCLICLCFGTRSRSVLLGSERLETMQGGSFEAVKGRGGENCRSHLGLLSSRRRRRYGWDCCCCGGCSGCRGREGPKEGGRRGISRGRRIRSIVGTQTHKLIGQPKARSGSRIARRLRSDLLPPCPKPPARGEDPAPAGRGRGRGLMGVSEAPAPAGTAHASLPRWQGGGEERGRVREELGGEGCQGLQPIRMKLPPEHPKAPPGPGAPAAGLLKAPKVPAGKEKRRHR